jgi:hypothetical protein
MQCVSPWDRLWRLTCCSATKCAAASIARGNLASSDRDDVRNAGSCTTANGCADPCADLEYPIKSTDASRRRARQIEMLGWLVRRFCAPAYDDWRERGRSWWPIGRPIRWSWAASAHTRPPSVRCPDVLVRTWRMELRRSSIEAVQYQSAMSARAIALSISPCNSLGTSDSSKTTVGFAPLSSTLM